MATLKDVTITPEDGAEKAFEIYQKFGGVLIKGLFAKEADSLNLEIDEAVHSHYEGLKNAPDFMKDFSGYKTKRVTQIPKMSKVFREEMLSNEFLLDSVDLIFDTVADSYWLSTAQVIEIQPGEKAQLIHRDADNYPIFRRYGKDAPDIMCNCIVALSEYTEEMGATRAILGSNNWDDFTYEPTQEETCAVVMEKGDAFLFSGKTLHGGGTNISDKPRRALAIPFNVGWLTPEEAIPMVVPWEMAKDLSPRIQQLLGYRSFHNTKLHGGSLWTVDFEELGDYMQKEY